MELKGAAILLAVILLAPLAYPQTAPAARTESPSIVSNVDEVTVDLVVHDKKNKPVLDLKPEDLAVTDSGSAVKLSDLRLVTGQSGAQRLVTLVFDRLDPSSAKNARDIATKILKMIPANQFSFSVLIVGGRLRLLQGFTSDVGAVEKAVSAATEPLDATKEDPALPEKNLITAAQTGVDSTGVQLNAEQRNLDRVTLSSLEESQKIVQDQHCLPSLAGLLALARTQRQFAGRKVIIFFEQAQPLDSNAKDLLLTIAGASNRASVSIYTVDANAINEQAGEGLITSAAIATAAPSVNQAANASISSGAPGIAQPRLPSGMIAQISDTLTQLQFGGLSGYKNPIAQLAQSTGGAYITGSDRLKKPLQQMIEDMTSYYEASYAPHIEEYDGKFRAVAVTPLRKGLKIHAKAGYFAVPPDTGTAVRPFEAPMMKALEETQLPSEVKFRSRVLRLGDLPTGNENTLVVEVPISELETRDDVNSNLYSLHVSMMGQVKSKAGVLIEHFGEDIPQHGSLDAKAAAQSDVVTMQRHFTAAPGQYLLEAAVLDRNNGKVSAQRVEFEVPNAASGPSLSDVTVVRRTIPTPPDVDSDEPMRYGNGKVVPDLSGRVAHGTKELSFFFLVRPDPSVTEQPTLEMEILKEGEPITQVPLTLRKTNGPGTIPYMASIQSGTLPSGNYSVIERLTQGGKTVEHEVAFQVEGPELAKASEPGAANAADTGDALTASDLASAGEDGTKGRRLVITTLPAGAVPAPSADELQAIVASTRKRALDYSKTLPNFVCVEVTNRSVDAAGNGKWKHRDSLAELLRYHDSQESRTTLQVNGKRSSLQRADMNVSWPLSVGEFGAMLNLVFQPASKTEFEYREAATREDRSGTVQVLSYRVLRENATITLGQGNEQLGVGFHGLLYIDPSTGGVQRITMEADGLPKGFSMSAAVMTVDYDYVAISDRDYLLPVRSTVSLQRHHKTIELNEITFQNYRRFASRSKIKFLQ